jgi:hypothetical protein
MDNAPWLHAQLERRSGVRGCDPSGNVVELFQPR